MLSEVNELDRKLAEAEALLIANPDYVAPGWQVYAIAPTVVEFWQGASDRNHKRLLFTLSADQNKWTRVRLSP